MNESTKEFKPFSLLMQNYVLKKENVDRIAERLSSFIKTSKKATVVMSLIIDTSHVVGIVAEQTTGKVVLHYMGSMLNEINDSLFGRMKSILQSYGYSVDLKVVEVEKEEYNNSAPEFIENVKAFLTGKNRPSQEEALSNYLKILHCSFIQSENHHEYIQNIQKIRKTY